jgi:hypothetical protein
MDVKKFFVYGGTILVSLALIAFSIVIGGSQAERLGFLPQRGFGPPRFPGVVFIFGRPLPGWLGVLSVIGAYLFLYISGLIVFFLIPRQMGVMRDAFLPAQAREAWKNWLFFLGVGILSLLALALLSALGLLTAAAFPLPLFLLALLLLVVWIGLITFGLVIGAGLHRLAGAQQAAPLGELALGLLVVFALGRLPFVGWLFTLLMAALSLGAVVATRLGFGGMWTLNGLEQGLAQVGADASVQQTEFEHGFEGLEERNSEKTGE